MTTQGFAFPLSKTEAAYVADVISLYLAVMPEKMHRRVEENMLDHIDDIAILALRLRNFITDTDDVPAYKEHTNETEFID